MGDPRAHWEVNTLVVETVGNNDQTWFDHSGNFHSDALHEVERFTLIDRDHIDYEVTIEDPKVFTRPWKMSMILYRHTEKNFQLLDYECYGFDVTFAKGLGFERIPEGAATQEILFKLGADAYANSKKADALVVSCGALRTLDLIVPLENEIKVPVVSSTPHGLMNGVRMLGVSPKAKGFGMVLTKA